MFDPVAHIEREHPDFTVERGPLRGALSCVDFRTGRVIVNDELDDGGFRASVCHEGVHLDRGDRCSLADTTLDARRERAVEQEAALRLISFPELVAALQAGQTDTETAARLGVDKHLFQLRVEMLDQDQWDHVNGVVDDQDGWTVA